MNILLFLSVIAVYIVSCPPTLMSGDGGEFITSACSLGISHPPGYPLYCLFGKLFSLFDISNFAWRITLGSVIFSALTAVLLSILIYELTKNRFISFVSSFIYALSSTVWSQALVAKVYPLNAFLIVLSMILLFRWQKSSDSRYLYVFGLVFGLSLTNHYPLIFIASPAYLAVIFLNHRALNLKNVIIASCFMFLGLVVYAYLPIRSIMNPPNNWGNPDNLHNFLNHVLRKQYRVLELTQNIGVFDKLKFIRDYFTGLYEQFNLLLIPALIGAWVLFKEDTKKFLSVSLLFLANSIALTYILHFSFNPERLSIVRVYYIPSYIAFTLFLAVGLKYFYSAYSSRIQRTAITGFVAFCLVWGVAFSCQNNFNRNDFLTYDYGRNMLSFLKKDSTLFIVKAGDESLFSTLYLQKVVKKRQDLKIIDCWGNVFLNIYGNDFSLVSDKDKWMDIRSRVEGEIIKNAINPVYYLSFSPDDIGKDIVIKKYGMVYIVDNENTITPEARIYQLYNYRGLDKKSFKDYQEREIAGFYYYSLAGQEFLKGFENSFQYFAKSAYAAYDVSWLINNIGLVYYRNGKLDMAKSKFLALLSDYPEYFEGRYNLGLVYKNLGLFDRAKDSFLKCIKYDPRDLDSFKELADVFYMSGEYANGSEIFKSVLKGNKKYAGIYYSSGTEFYLKKDIQKAIDEWQKAIIIKDDYAIVYYNLGVAYLELKDNDNARKALNKYLVLEPDSALSGNVRSVLKDLPK